MDDTSPTTPPQPRYLVTGGAGFIGRHLVRRLLADGAQVTVVDDLSAGHREDADDQVRFVQGDIRDAALMAALAGDADTIFHLAACVSVTESIRNWRRSHDINLGGTVTVLGAAHQAGNVPVIYASSAAVYGPGSASGANDENLMPRPISPYAADKLGCEHQAAAMAAIHGLPSVGLRFFNVYGAGQDAASPYAGVIARFLANRLAGRAHDIFGDGLQSRDFLHVDDVVAGLLLARDHVGPRQGTRVYNLCTGIGSTLLDVISVLDGLAGGDALPLRFHPARDGDIRRSLGSAEAARQDLGFAAQVSLQDGLARLWDQANGSAE